MDLPDTKSAGYTSLGIALALPEDGRLYALDIEEEYANVGVLILNFHVHTWLCACMRLSLIPSR